MKPDTTKPEAEIPLNHWADQAASELIEKKPSQAHFVCASGISPSGVVHIGNFREVITTEFVVRALRSRGKTVRFLYSWDEYDALRKVPANLPNKDKIEAAMRKPLAEAPDPFGQEKSYAAQFEKRFENEIRQLGIAPEYIYQAAAYKSCKYAKGIEHALRHEKQIKAILDRARTEPLPENWSCLSVFCATCGKDITEVTAYEPPTIVKYRCKCDGRQTEHTTDFAKEGRVKLLWRIDWPMRWAHEQVDFEPGGKDHSSQGGSYETGAMIEREVWNREPPHYVQYDFVLAKGLGAKFSSSSGNLLTVSQALEVYEPALLRWVFASRKPNLDFSLAFDLDVLKAYDDFDRCERIAYGTEAAEPKKANYERRIYEMASVTELHLDAKNLPAAPTQFPLRHLCNILQVFEGDLEKTRAHYGVGEKDHARFDVRARCAWKWITEYAPEAFRFSLRAENNPPPKSKYPELLGEVATLLESPNAESMTEDTLGETIFKMMKDRGLQPKDFFGDVYQTLIAKPAGPKLASFFRAVGLKRSATYLRRAL